MTKKYEDLKNPPTPPDLDEEEQEEEEEEEKEEEKTEEEEKEEEEKEEEEGSDEGKEEEEEEKEEEETPVWAKQLSENVGSITERLDKIEEKAGTPPATPPSKPADDEFTPDFEKGLLFPKNYKPKNYNEHAQKLLALQDAKRKHAETVKTEQQKKWHKAWDDDLNQLTKEGKLPEVKNASDPKDPGKVARAKLLKDAISAGSTSLISFYNVVSGYKTKVKKTPPSSRAPIGGEKSGDKATKGIRKYKDLKKDLEAVKAEKYPELVS